MGGVKRILQIIPANGWCAEFGDRDGRLVEPLIAWAVVEYEDGRQGIEGYVGDGEQYTSRAESVSNFVAYRGPSMES